MKITVKMNKLEIAEMQNCGLKVDDFIHNEIGIDTTNINDKIESGISILECNNIICTTVNNSEYEVEYTVDIDPDYILDCCKMCNKIMNVFKPAMDFIGIVVKLMNRKCSSIMNDFTTKWFRRKKKSLSRIMFNVLSQFKDNVGKFTGSKEEHSILRMFYIRVNMKNVTIHVIKDKEVRLLSVIDIDDSKILNDKFDIFANDVRFIGDLTDINRFIRCLKEEMSK